VILHCNAQDGIKTNVQNNPYYPFPMCGEHRYIPCLIVEKDIKMYYDTVLKEENTALNLPRFKTWYGIQKVAASIPGDQTLRL